MHNRSRRSPLPIKPVPYLARPQRLRSTRPVRLGLLAMVLTAFTAVGPSAYSAPQAPSLPAGGYVAPGSGDQSWRSSLRMCRTSRGDSAKPIASDRSASACWRFSCASGTVGRLKARRSAA